MNTKEIPYKIYLDGHEQQTRSPAQSQYTETHDRRRTQSGIL